jgi:hypothetical protein
VYAGIPYAIGEVDLTRRSDFQRVQGLVMQSGTVDSTGHKALLTSEFAPSGGGGIGSTVLASGTPFTIGSTDAMYFSFRLRYWCGV